MLGLTAPCEAFLSSFALRLTRPGNKHRSRKRRYTTEGHRCVQTKAVDNQASDQTPVPIKSCATATNSAERIRVYLENDRRPFPLRRPFDRHSGKGCSKFSCEQFRLLKSSEVAAYICFMIINQVVICLFGPRARRLVEFLRKYRYTDR